MTQYSIPSANASSELIIKRSQFLSFAGRAQNRQQAEAFIQHYKQQYKDASHVCWAYIAGPPKTTVKSMSDDGEPSGSAGRPMLNCLEHSDIFEIVVAVVRYFGGTELGVGGLQRAYSDAVLGVIEVLPTTLFVPTTKFVLHFDFKQEHEVRYVCQRWNVTDLQFSYGEQIEAIGHIASQHLADFFTHLTNHSKGTCSYSILDQ